MSQNITAFITGASRGIGSSIALRLANEHITLGLLCRQHTNELRDIKIKCESLGAKCFTYQADVSEHFQTKQAISDFKQAAGHIDWLINNAGISYVGLLTDMSIEEWDKIISTNLTSLFNTCHAAIPYMLHEKKGRILNISSVWGNAGASCEVAYSASKGGVNAFTKALAKELAPSGISVNALAYGVIDTSMNQFLSSEEKLALCDDIPSGRFGTSEEAADMAYSLLTSPSYLTGQIVTLDGGWS